VAVDVLIAVLLFLAGLLAKPIVELASELVRLLVTRRQTHADAALAHADRSSEQCLEALAVLRDEKLLHLNRSRAESRGGIAYPERGERSQRVNEATAQLEANIELLHPDAREPMRLVVDVVWRLQHIDAESGAEYAHYDFAWTILSEAIRYGRKLLGAQLRREKVPPLTRKMREYAIVLDDEDKFWSEVSSDDQSEARRQTWITEHADELGPDGKA
jgi:hypothetical protein